MTHHYVDKLNGEIIYNTALKELLTDETGRVVGAVCDKLDGSKLTVYVKDAVIITTGGYARNKEMCSRYPVAHYFSTAPKSNTGEGLVAAENIGAKNLVHPGVQVVYTSLTCGIGINDESGLIVNERGERYPVAHYFSTAPKSNTGEGLVAAENIGAKNLVHPGVQVVYTSLTCGIGINDESGLIVNERGERVVNEWSYQYHVSDAIANSNSNCGWYITSGNEPYGGVQYGFKQALDGVSRDKVADSIEELAEKIHIDPKTLRATYDRYCELVEKGEDEDFGKPAKFLHPIEGPKFAALRLHPCVTVTFGGLETDLSSRVLDNKGDPIPGLFAAGEVAGTGMYGT